MDNLYNNKALYELEFELEDALKFLNNQRHLMTPRDRDDFIETIADIEEAIARKKLE